MKLAILITQCLQNDFVKVIGPYDPLPNKLHIGYDEVVRLFGERPQEGMLFNLMKWAYEQPSEVIRIINIRDWHDPDEPEQQKHLEQFGIHCIKNSKGAEFVFERIRNEQKDVVINASGLNDFVDTGLEIILNEFKGHEIRVGIIGVWTEAKVSYLSYDISSRFPEFDIAICSGLTASSSTHMHYVSLGQLRKILDVKVYSSVTEFANFLSGQEISLALEKEKDFHQADFKFDNENALQKNELQLLSHLFRNSKEVSFTVLDGGFSGNIVMKANAVDIHGHEELPTVIKIGSRNEIAHERDSFEKIQDVLGNNAPSIVGYLENQGRAAIKYRYASMFDEEVVTFQQYYAKCNELNQIKNILDIVFIKQLGRFYRAATLEKINLLSYYEFSTRFAGSVIDKVSNLIGPIDPSKETIKFEGKECYNLTRFYQNDLKYLSHESTQSHYTSYLHGDLNGANIIVDARENIWLIDFFHTHRGHVLKDLIKLENDVTYIFMKISSKQEFDEATLLIDMILNVEDLSKPLPKANFNSPELSKAYDTIRQIRSYIPALVQFDRGPLQLFIGLLRYSVHTLSFEECSIWQKKLALYTSCKLAKDIKDYILKTKKLRIDILPSTEKKIGMTILPGRADRNRDLDADLKEIENNGFRSIVILLGDQELENYGVKVLLEKYSELNLKIYQINIMDQGVPSKQEMIDLCKWINDELQHERKVLLHCVGGIGRTGTAAACYLKKYKGYNSLRAIEEVRASRSPRSIETKEQEEFVKHF